MQGCSANVQANTQLIQSTDSMHIISRLVAASGDICHCCWLLQPEAAALADGLLRAQLAYLDALMAKSVSCSLPGSIARVTTAGLRPQVRTTPAPQSTHYCMSAPNHQLDAASNLCVRLCLPSFVLHCRSAGRPAHALVHLCSTEFLEVSLKCHDHSALARCSINVAFTFPNEQLPC